MLTLVTAQAQQAQKDLEEQAQQIAATTASFKANSASCIAKGVAGYVIIAIDGGGGLHASCDSKRAVPTLGLLRLIEAKIASEAIGGSK